MRIAYVTIHVAPEIMRGGVGRKIQNQVARWRAEEHDVTLFSLTPAEIQLLDARQFVFDDRNGLLQREISRYRVLVQMLASIREYKPDLIYLRYGLYSYPLHRLFTIAPVVLEANSYDVKEYRKRGPFFYWMNRLTRPLTFGPACGLIVPSYELRKVLLPRSNKPVCIISNGIDVNGFPPFPPPGNAAPVITLVGSPGMDWHGVDKLIHFAGIYPDVIVNIVGYSEKDIETSVPPNVHLFGFLDQAKLKEVLKNTDVACGTLALHRKNMEEACPLKVREALAHGIPVILGYMDTDLNGLELDTILRIPNTDDNVASHADQIHTFAYNMVGKRVDRDLIRNRIDQVEKEKDRLRFFVEVLSVDKK